MPQIFRTITSKLAFIAFWILFFVLFFVSFTRFVSTPNGAELLLDATELAICLAFIQSAEMLARIERMISAQFALLGALLVVILLLLSHLATAPLSTFLSPDIVRSSGQHLSSVLAARAVDSVGRIYSIFDVITFIGTMGTLVLIAIGALIPEEARLLQLASKLFEERSNTTKQYIDSINAQFRCDTTLAEYVDHKLERGSLWTHLLLLLSDAPELNIIVTINGQIELLLSPDYRANDANLHLSQSDMLLGLELRLSETIGRQPLKLK